MVYSDFSPHVHHCYKTIIALVVKLTIIILAREMI